MIRVAILLGLILLAASCGRKTNLITPSEAEAISAPEGD